MTGWNGSATDWCPDVRGRASGVYFVRIYFVTNNAYLDVISRLVSTVL